METAKPDTCYITSCAYHACLNNECQFHEVMKTHRIPPWKSHCKKAKIRKRRRRYKLVYHARKMGFKIVTKDKIIYRPKDFEDDFRLKKVDRKLREEFDYHVQFTVEE